MSKPMYLPRHRAPRRGEPDVSAVARIAADTRRARKVIDAQAAAGNAAALTLAVLLDRPAVTS